MLDLRFEMLKLILELQLVWMKMIFKWFWNDIFFFFLMNYDGFKPEIYEVNYMLNDSVRGCRNKYFHTFEYRCVYDINFTKITNNESFFYHLHSNIQNLNVNFMD